MRDYSLILLANGALKVFIWTLGTALAAWRKRAGLVAGFGLACGLAALRAFDDATQPDDLFTVGVAFAATPAAGLIVASFIGRQPSQIPRPAHWSL